MVMAARSIAPLRRSLSTNIIGMPWKSLGFDFTQTRSMLRYNLRDGEWDSGELLNEFMLNIGSHIAYTRAFLKTDDGYIAEEQVWQLCNRNPMGNFLLSYLRLHSLRCTQDQ